MVTQRAVSARQDTEVAFRRQRIADSHARIPRSAATCRQAVAGSVAREFRLRRIAQSDGVGGRACFDIPLSDKDKLEVDFVLESSAGKIVGIEVKPLPRSHAATSPDWNASLPQQAPHSCRGSCSMTARKPCPLRTTCERCRCRFFAPDSRLPQSARQEMGTVVATLLRNPAERPRRFQDTGVDKARSTRRRGSVAESNRYQIFHTPRKGCQ